MQPSEELVRSWTQAALTLVYWNSSENPTRYEDQEGSNSWRFTFFPRTRTCALSGRGPDGIVGWKFESLSKLLEFFGYDTNINKFWNKDAN